MSAGITVRAWELRKALSDIVPLFPKGSHVVPVLFSLNGEDLLFTCTTGCVYTNTITVSNQNSESWETTVIYKNLLDFIPGEGNIYITHQPYGLTITGEDFEVQLPIGYSIITPSPIPDVQFTKITTDSYIRGFRDLVGMGLADIYAADKPIHLYDNVAVLKYPNVQVQARTTGLGLQAVMAPEHIRLFARFAPEEWYTNNVDVVILKRKRAYLELPMEPRREDNHFLELLSDMSEPVTLDVEHYIEKLRSMSKMNSRGRCKIVLFENGVSTTLSQDNVSIKAGLGDVHGTVLTSLYLPLPLWLTMIKALGSGKAQFMFRRDIICLRTQAIIIIARALV